MPSIQILVGSVMGTAEQVAETIEPLLASQYSTSVSLEPAVDELTADEQDILLFCTSNTGAGELPDTLQTIYQTLQNGAVDLSGRHYGLINLGSSAFTTYGQAGRDLDTALSSCGAQRIGEVLTLDACSGNEPADEACQWVADWLQTLRHQLG